MAPCPKDHYDGLEGFDFCLSRNRQGVSGVSSSVYLRTYFVCQMVQQSIPNATMVYHAAFPNGGSAPRVCDFDDMVHRLVKWHPSSHGLTCTYSELIASRLGQLIGAPLVRGTVVYVDVALLPPDIAARVTQPFHVGFTYSPGQNFSPNDYDQLKNRGSFPAAAVHLAWLQVGDQGGHNQYLYQLEQVLPDKTTRKMNHYILIDQAFICGSPDWSKNDLRDPAVPYTLPLHLKRYVTMAQVEPLLHAVELLDETEIRACFGSYPEGWGITDEHVQKVTTFILDRRRHLPDVLRANLS